MAESGIYLAPTKHEETPCTLVRPKLHLQHLLKIGHRFTNAGNPSAIEAETELLLETTGYQSSSSLLKDLVSEE